jgi:hypothetical protein
MSVYRWTISGGPMLQKLEAMLNQIAEKVQAVIDEASAWIVVLVGQRKVLYQRLRHTTPLPTLEKANNPEGDVREDH